MKIDEVISGAAINDLIKLCKSELELNNLPLIKFINDPIDGSRDQPSFGKFSGDTITVVIKGRHLIDISRTLAHELVHWKQRSEGMNMNGDTGSKIENQANATAGVIMRKFGKKYPEHFLNTIP